MRRAPALLAAAGLTLACASSRAGLDPASTEESHAHLRGALDAYREGDFLVGPPEFPVVGRALTLPGPGDSMWVGFSASLPPAALRFSREGDLFAARYQVTLLVLDGADTLRRIERRETVRVDDFPETVGRDPRIVFQRFVLAPARRLEVGVTVRELSSRREATARLTVMPPRGLARPLVAYRAATRRALDQSPPVIASPRNTLYAAEGAASLLLEGGTADTGRVLVSAALDGQVVWSDSVRLTASPGAPATLLLALPVRRLPPGRATLAVEGPGDGTIGTVALYVGLDLEWVPPSWSAAADQLRYAPGGDTLEAWSEISPRERSVAWEEFLDRTDPDPSTPSHEYLERYFDRMSLANDRYDEPGRAGWESDRGQVLVRLGEPDRQRFVRPERQGEVPRLEWEYEESESGRALIVFEDATDFGVYVLTPRSRAVVRRLERERSSG